jgi:hypothetical protein
MKTLITLLLFTSLTTQGQKWYKITKNDIAVMTCEVGAGYAKGWADEIEFHHYELSQRFPGLFKNENKFWDGRYDDDGMWDAKHMMVGIATGFHITAICIKVGDLKSYPKKDRWKKVLFDAAKYYLSYQLGFALSYNLTHSNKIF